MSDHQHKLVRVGDQQSETRSLNKSSGPGKDSVCGVQGKMPLLASADVAVKRCRASK